MLQTYGLKKAALLLVCGVLPLLAAFAADGQTYQYEIRYGSNAVGLLDVRQETAGASRKITIQSRVQAKLFARMETDILTEYQHNVLSRAHMKRLSTNEETLTEKTDKGYSILRKGDKRSHLPERQISYCISDLYFTEPRDIKKVYSETQGRFLEVQQLPDKRYAVVMPEGKKNIYRYEKGRLMEVEINHSLGKAWFKLIEHK